MFLRNSVLLLTSVILLFPLNLISKKIEISIPKIAYHGTINSHKIEAIDNLEDLSFGDKIILKKDKEIIYYKVINKFYSKNDAYLDRQIDASTLILKSENNLDDSYLVVIAINVGKMVQK